MAVSDTHADSSTESERDQSLVDEHRQAQRTGRIFTGEPPGIDRVLREKQERLL